MALVFPSLAPATPIRNARTESNVDWVAAGLGGLGGGSGTIQVAGVSGIVRRAFLYWHGIDRQSENGNGVYDNQNITFNGTPITGEPIGDATTNCWEVPPTNGSSRAFRADVSALVGGNGSYSVSGLSGQTGHSANGASLVVLFNDGNGSNNRDLVFFEGNDSNNTEGFAGEDNGWHATLAGINYQGGTVRAQLHAADGQGGAGFFENSLTFSSSAGTVTIPDVDGRWEGNSVPSAGSSRADNGALWDVHAFDLNPAFGAPGSYTLSMDGMTYNDGDCLGLVLLLLDLEAGSAPPTPTPTATPPTTGGCTEYMSDNVPIDLPDLATINSTLNATMGGSITDVDVVVLIGTHSYVGDLRFGLRSPAGTTVSVMNQACNQERFADFDLDLDDEAGSSIPCPPTDAIAHTPSNPLSAFDGQQAAGTWTLEVADLAANDSGRLDSWGLRICTGGGGGPTNTPTATRTPTQPTSAGCCSEHEAPGCEVSDCQNCVCQVASGCCSETWDELCTMIANNECALSCPCVTPTRTRTRTVTPTPTISRTSTHTGTATRTTTHTPFFTVTPTHSVTRTFTPPVTFTATSTITASSTATHSGTPTRTATATGTTTPTSGADLIAEHIEVSQAIQDLNNTVRLVARKRTYVRFHVRSSLGNVIATARLRVQRGAETVTLDPINPRGRILVRDNPNRGVLDHAFLFALPSGVRSDTIQLSAELNPDNAPAENNRANNTVTTQVTFEPVPAQTLVMYKVGYSSGGQDIYPSDVHRAQAVVWMRRAFPISDLRVLLRSYLFGRAVANDRVLSEPSCVAVNAFLTSKRLFDLASSDEVPATARYYGLVEDTAGFMRGCAVGIPASVASGPNGVPGPGSWDTDGSYGDWYTGHEIGHTLGRLHAEFCGAQGGGPFPYPEGRISPTLTGPNAIYGFDIVDREIYGPDWRDVMSYCPYQWVSDFTYEGLLDFYRRGAPPAFRLGGPAGIVDRLLVVGTIDPSTDDVRLEPLFIVPSAPELKERIPGPYAIVLRDPAGAELARYPFTPDVVDEGPSPVAIPDDRDVDLLFINELVPFVAGTSRVEIVGPTGALLHAVTAGPAAPTVTLLSPSGGETLDQPTVTLRWRADDPDGDLLTFSVQYSRNDGGTWEMIAQFLQGSEVTLDAANIGRTDAGRFRILVSDGVHTGSDDSDAPFVVPNRVPSAVIVSPDGPTTMASGQTLALDADVYDVDVGTLADEQIQWSSDRDGGLGNGATLEVTNLSVGMHVLTVRADDGEGGVTTDTVEVTVVAEIGELPPVPDALVVGPPLITIDAAAEAQSGRLAIDNQNTENALEWQASASDPLVRLGATSGTTPAEVQVTIDPTGLAPGAYAATITVSSAAGERTVGVEARVTVSCPGDCDGSGAVAVNELVRGVNIALGNSPVGECASFDGDGSGAVAVNELVQAVNSLLNGCT